MRCPHCLIDFAPAYKNYDLDSDITGGWDLKQFQCSACGKNIFYLEHSCHKAVGRHSIPSPVEVKTFMVYPRSHSRKALPEEIPEQYANDYNEACLVLSDSPKASAALSRRCLQSLLREVEKIKPGNLDSEIQQVIDRGKLPSQLSESIDAIRNIGNFSAHPIKSTNSGEIIDVEDGEAEWSLDVLEALFDYYFIQPAMLKKKKDALNEKLREAGKKEMK